MKKFLTTLFTLLLAVVVTVQPARAASFSDVPTSHWAYGAIHQMADQGLINGYPDGTYKLNAPVTRAQAAKIIALAIKAKPSATFTPNFTDVSPAHGSYDYIRALTERGIFANGEKFRPNDPLTRGQMSKIIVLGYNMIVDDNDFIRFRDVTKQSQYYGNIITIAELGITTTPPGGTFNPNDSLSRAQMAAFIQRTEAFKEKRAKGLIHYDEKKKQYIETSKPVLPPAEPEPPVIQPGEHAAQSMKLVNEQRKKEGLALYKADPELSKIAQLKAEDMAKNNYFSHTSPTYGSVSDMLDRYKYKWTGYGENIAMGYTDASEAVAGWMNSPGHRKNTLDPNFTNIGAGYAMDGNGTTYWVHQFTKK